MNNQEKLVAAFATALGIESSLVTDDLQYNTISQWDSVAHMVLIAELEKVFNVMFDTDQIIDMSSVLKAKQMLAAHGVSF